MERSASDEELQAIVNRPDHVHYCCMLGRPGISSLATQIEFTWFKPDTEANNAYTLTLIRFPFTPGEEANLWNTWMMISVPGQYQDPIDALLWQHGLKKVLPDNVPLCYDKDGEHVFPAQGPNVFYLENHSMGAENVVYKNDPEKLKAAIEHEAEYVESFHREHRKWLRTPEGRAEAEAYWKKYNIAGQDEDFEAYMARDTPPRFPGEEEQNG